jgi:hypothetical protein
VLNKEKANLSGFRHGSGDFSRAIPSFSNPISFLLGKSVVVKAEGYTVKGSLIHYQTDSKNPHKPSVLILESQFGKILIRGNWTVIATYKR